MKRINTGLATLAVVLGLTGSATAIPTIWVSDKGGGLSTDPVTSPSGVVTYTSTDPFWTIVVSTGVVYPPAIGQGTLSSPVMDISVTATSVGGANASDHPLTVILGADGFGPTSDGFLATLSGHAPTGTGQQVTFDTFYSTANPNAMPADTALTSSGSLLNYNGTWMSTGLDLAAPYSLSEVVTIQATGDGATYSLDGSLTTVPDGGTTVLLLGAALSGLGLIRRKLA
jgi:VPDSG-CTERM motif